MRKTFKVILDDAYDALKESTLPKDLYGAALPDAIRIAEKNESEIFDDTGSDSEKDAFAGNLYEKTAARLRIDAHAVADVLELAPDRVQIIVAPSRLPKQKAAAMRDVALLICAGRQAVEIDDGWTAAEVIRRECRDVGVFDQANFAGEIGSMGDVFNFKGTGRSREVRVNARGYEQAGRRITELVGEDA